MESWRPITRASTWSWSAPHRLAFTWGDGGSDSSRVVVEIAPLDNGCELTLTHELHPDWADFAARTEAGWTKMLEALARMM